MDSENLTNRERCLLRAIGMIKDRMIYYVNARETSVGGFINGMRSAYGSATAILEFAWDEDWETLNQFDYFGEKK